MNPSEFDIFGEQAGSLLTRNGWVLVDGDRTARITLVATMDVLTPDSWGSTSGTTRVFRIGTDDSSLYLDIGTGKPAEYPLSERGLLSLLSGALASSRRCRR
jgi:hypothetical protein